MKEPGPEMRKVKRPRKSPNPSKHYFNERLHNITSANLTMPSTTDDPVQAAQQEIIMDLEEMEESDDYLAIISNLPVDKPGSPQASSSGLQAAGFSGTQEVSSSKTQHASGSDMPKSPEDLANIHEGQSNIQDGQVNVYESKASMPEDQDIPEGKASMPESQGVQETNASIQEGQSNTPEDAANIQEATASMQGGQASIQADQSVMPSQPGPSSSNSNVEYYCEKVLEESNKAVYDRNAMAYAIDAELEKCIEEVAMAQREAAARNTRMANEQKD